MRNIHRPVMMAVLAASILLPCATASAQRLSERIKYYHQQQSKRPRQDSAAQRQRAQQRIMQRRMRSLIAPVKLEQVPVRDALAWWSKTTGAQMVVNWKAMENNGINPQTPIQLKLKSADATTVLEMILQQAALDAEPLIFEVKPWFVQIMTRSASLRRPVTKIYYIGDLLINVPNFRDAPSLGVGSALGGDDDDDDDDRGGGGGDDDDDDDGRMSKAQRADQIVQLIRDTIEPDIWIANGGQYASIRYFQSRLIVRAPMWVQRQIGAATGSGAATSSGGTIYGRAVRRPQKVHAAATGTKGVSSVEKQEPTPEVSSVQEKKK